MSRLATWHIFDEPIMLFEVEVLDICMINKEGKEAGKKEIEEMGYCHKSCYNNL